MIRRGRQAFTLIEILVVIGIILVLISIGVIGFQHIDKAASEKATKARFETCNSLLSEYEANTASLNAVEGPSGAIYFSANGLPSPSSPVANPGDVNLGGTGRTAIAVSKTGAVLQLFQHVPQAQTQIAQLPAAATLALSTGTNPSVVILDAWKNPIIYVPSGGLSGVTVTRGTSTATVTVTSVDGRPFWASGGQDGNFTNGDDNLYSTAVIVH